MGIPVRHGRIEQGVAVRTLAALGLLAAIVIAVAATACGGGSGNGSARDEKLTEGVVEAVERMDWKKTDFSKHLVPLEELRSGGPPKDGIPAIDAPRYTRAEEVHFLQDREPVILVTVDGESRAFPLQILTWHEIVNTSVAGTPVAVTFCPLCYTAIAFDRRLDGHVLDFGTTGKLRNSDLVMYDRQTESWWQQLEGKALVGKLAGKRLQQLPARIVSWREFRSKHPAGLVLNRRTGFTRDYGSNPYPGYDDIASPPFFPARNGDDDRLPPKERVVYVEVGTKAYAVPYSALVDKRTIEFDTDAGELVVRWKAGVASALDAATIAGGHDVGAASVLLEGEPVAFTEPFWFAVAAFRPDIEIVR